MSAYNTTKTQNIVKMYTRVVIEKNPSIIIRKNNEEVWRFESDSKGYYLFHYGTFILFIGHDGTVKNGYGWSRTDARNINGLLSLFNIHNVCAHIKNFEFRLD